MKEIKMNISGMSCHHCIERVKKAIAKLPGISSTKVDVGSATISFDETVVSEADIKQALEKAGYGVI